LSPRIYFSRLLISMICLLAIPLTALAEPARVAVLPFAIHSDKDYDFLRQGIVQMLTSRLTEPGKVTVVDPVATESALAAAGQAKGDDLARQVGQTLGADYAIHGSLTILGDSVSIDAKTLDLTGARPPMAFFKQTQGLGNVIGEINLMAGEINERIFGVEKAAAVATPSPAAAPAPTTAPPSASGAPAQPDIHMHPEKLLQQGRPITTGTSPLPASPLAGSPLSGSSKQQPSSTLNPAFVPAQGMQASQGPGFWKSRNFNELINGIDVGDVDNDGLLETVVAMPERILILRFSQGRQQTVTEIKTDRFVRNISVSVADINGNGTPEIFVTALTIGLDVVSSSVLEFDGGNYKPIVEKSRYYYNVIRHPVLGARLFGQPQNGRTDPFNGAIFEMEWKGVDYEPTNQVLAANKANVLGMTIGDVTTEQSESIVAFTSRDRLQLLLQSGKTEWKGDDPYGGTTLYFSSPPTDPDSKDSASYFPIRLRTVDLDRNGKSEILTAKNFGSTGRMLDRQRYFSKSNILALVWDGLGLTPAWQTRQLTGRVQDLLVADFDNDGNDELLAALIAKEGAIIFTDAQSTLIAFDLALPRK